MVGLVVGMVVVDGQDQQRRSTVDPVLTTGPKTLPSLDNVWNIVNNSIE